MNEIDFTDEIVNQFKLINFVQHNKSEVLILELKNSALINKRISKLRVICLQCKFGVIYLISLLNCDITMYVCSTFSAVCNDPIREQMLR
jgi:hypothetical protein